MKALKLYEELKQLVDEDDYNSFTEDWEIK